MSILSPMSSDASAQSSSVVIESPVGIGAISKILFVSSGKGGVGKSTVAVNVALALWRSGRSVGLLDVDLCGPSVPRMLGTKHTQVTRCDDGWLPVYVPDYNDHGDDIVDGSAAADLSSDHPDVDRGTKGPARPPLAVMSIGFLLARETDAVIWRGAKKNSMIESLLSQVHWGKLDWLIVDTPPGTSDEKITLATVVKTRFREKFAGALIVTTPQMVALNDVRKEISFYAKIGLPVLGLLENMAGLVCPRCGHLDRVFSAGGGAALAQARSVPFLGALPLRPLLARLADSGLALATADSRAELARDHELQAAMTRVLQALSH